MVSHTVAAGVVTLNRTGRLGNLLSSIAEHAPRVRRVYIGDNGHSTAEKDALYNSTWPFDVSVLDLEYDIGTGTARREITDACEADFLLMADDDHELLSDLDPLLAILEADASIGGVAGNIVEGDPARMWQSGKDFHEEGDTLIRTAAGDKTLERPGGQPFVPWDFTPYPALFRTAIFEDYSFDPEYPHTRTHADFYVGHWTQTDWRFGISPAFTTFHNPGGPDEYMDERHDPEKKRRAVERFREKWGYRALNIEQGYWFDTEDQ